MEFAAAAIAARVPASASPVFSRFPRGAHRLRQTEWSAAAGEGWGCTSILATAKTKATGEGCSQHPSLLHFRHGSDCALAQAGERRLSQRHAHGAQMKVGFALDSPQQPVEDKIGR